MRPDYQRGQIYPLIAFMLFSIVALSALAVDMGYYRYAQRHQQTATDSAAIAAAAEGVYASPNAENAAYADAAQNGFATSDPNTTITAIPWSDAYTGSFTAFKVTIDKTYPKFFSGYFGGGRRHIVTTAVGRLASLGSPCILTTSTTTGSNWQGDTFSGPNCGITTNACPNLNGATITVDNLTVPSGCSTSNATALSVTPTTETNPVPDPCPYIAGCNYLSMHYTPDTSGCQKYTAASKTETKAILTGNCYTGISINKGESVTFQPAGTSPIVVINTGTGNTFNLNQPTSVTATGVTFYVTTNSTFSMSGVTSVNMSAPTSGDTQDILFYQASTSDLNFSNANTAAAWNLDGVIYAPNAGNLNLNGNIDLGATTLVISPHVNLNCPGGKGPCITAVNPATGSSGGATAPVLAE